MSQLDPGKVLDPERFLDYEGSVTRSRLVPLALARLTREGMRVGDVGGASGVFLNELLGHTEQPFSGTVLELSAEYRERLINPSLDFQQVSIVDNDLPDGQFDLTTARHVLHHLVGANQRATLALQRRGVEEMIRITKPGGWVLIEEHVNRIKPFSRFIYQASYLANRCGFKWHYFELGGVVVSFLTPEELMGFARDCARIGTVAIERQSYLKRKVGLRWRLTQLMAYCGDQLLVLQKLR